MATVDSEISDCFLACPSYTTEQVVVPVILIENTSHRLFEDELAVEWQNRISVLTIQRDSALGMAHPAVVGRWALMELTQSQSLDREVGCQEIPRMRRAGERLTRGLNGVTQRGKRYILGRSGQ